MSKEEADLIKLMITLRDANAMAVEAINAYLEGKAPPEVKAEKLNELFPKELADLLSLEDTPEYTIIRPKRYLGKDNFARIAVIVKDHGGEYISQGRQSHFRISRKS